MKLENALKRLVKEGAVISVIKDYYYTANFLNNRIEFTPSREDFWQWRI